MARSRLALGVAAITALLIPVAVDQVGASPAPPSTPVIRTVSSAPDLVTAGDALVEVRVHDLGAARHLRVERDGEDITAVFQQTGPTTFLGLVDGLTLGPNELVAKANGNGRGNPGGRSAALTVVNHPKQGPVISGPQQQPFFCRTEAAGLGPALDEQCSAPTQVVYRYRTTSGAFRSLADPAVVPADAARVVVNGTEAPFVVRLERGVINRAIYEIASLHDGEQPSPFRAEELWNEALVLTFGGGCNAGYHQGTGTAGVLNGDILSRGYAVASASLLVNNTNCNPVTAAETATMLKERVIESFGPLRHTIGWGGSGGAIMQYTIAHAYPGVLDGLLPQISYPDSVSLPSPSDCKLLYDYVTDPATAALGWTPEQLRLVGGHQVFNTCISWTFSFADRIDATRGCDPAVPMALWYDPITNPNGVRCALADHLVTQLGRDPATGFARSLFHNDGVQYGLQPLLAGQITVEQFLDLNERIGGYDTDGLRQPARSIGDAVGIENAFATGLVTSGLGGLARTPTIDLRAYLDSQAYGDIHTSFWSEAINQRIVRDGGDPGIHARWIYLSGPRPTEALDAMEAWLNAIAADRDPGTAAEKAVRNRPAAAADGCWPAGGPKVEDLDRCLSSIYPISGDPRTVAGAPITNDVLRCVQVPADRADYPTMNDEQWAQIEATFPNGVCDYNQPGIGSVPLEGTWQRYG